MAMSSTGLMESIKKQRQKPSSSKRKNVQVVVRTRPMSEAERQARCKSVVACDSVSKVVTLNPITDATKHGQRTFGPFDKVYGPESTQSQVYADVVRPLMKEVLLGYNCTVFAYGQTGSGKTFTMEGRHDDSTEHTWQSDPTAGIIPRAIHHIFTELDENEVDSFTVRASYVELYNEQIYDLLSLSDSSQTDSLRIFDDKNKGVSIVGAEEAVVRNRDEVYSLLKRGAEKRRTAATLMNISSSRSHSVFTVTVMMREVGLVSGEELLRQGKLNLVDLAGSENVGRSGATEKRAREAGNINTSLLTLGRVITALTTNAGHIPYRESKLTRILQESLGGKTITTIIATLSPASSNFEESANTLEYAQRAKSIKNCPELNQKITRKGLLKDYNDEIERLRRDLVAAREKTGIYIDQENYDNMQEEIGEKKSRVEELEGQLEYQLYRGKILSENIQMIMDNHYKNVYEKCQAALAKLERRRVENESLTKDLALTDDNLRAATAVLTTSENSFVRLRSQAYLLQSKCGAYYHDLGALHDRLATVKEVFVDNDHLLGNFVAQLITMVNKAKTELQTFEQRTGDLSTRCQETAYKIEQSTSKSSDELRQLGMFVQQQLKEYGQQLDVNLKELHRLRSTIFNDFNASLTKTTTAFGHFQDESGQAKEKLIASTNSTLNDFKRAFDACYTSLTGNVNKFISEDRTAVGKFSGEFQELGSAFGRFCADSATTDEKMAERMDEDMSKLLLNSSDCHSRQNIALSALSQSERSGLKNVCNTVMEQKSLSLQMAHSMTSTLDGTQKSTEHFIHQEFKRIQPTGLTPRRPHDESFAEDLEDLPSTNELLSQEHRLLTPRRASFYRANDSILDSSAFHQMLSPNTLKQNLATEKLDSVGELSEEKDQ